MTTIQALSAPAVLEHARTMVPTLSERAPEVEAGRRVPADLVDEMRRAGYFRMLLPQSHAGAEATLWQALELYETLATGDASVGWAVMIGASGWCDLASLPRATFDEVFAPPADVIVAGAFAPQGSISPVEGGYELTGRWAFASGCEHATHFFANAIEGFADGHPLMRVSVLDASDVVIEDTWDVAGLCGTGSHHFSVSGVIVPPERTLVPLSDSSDLDTPIVRIPAPAVFALGIAAVACGTARGGLDAIVDVAQGKVPLLAPGPLATAPLFHHDLARAEAQLGAARAFLAEVTEQLWATAEAGTEPSLEDRARARAAAVWATDASLAVTEFAFRAGGGGAVYDASSLQRRLRDVHAVAQHFLVRPDTYVAAGSILAGQGLPVPVF